MKRFPTRSLAYWGILAVEATNKNQEDGLEDGNHLQKTGTRCYHLHFMCTVLQYTLLLTYIMKAMLPIEVEVPSVGVLLKSKLDGT